MERVKALRAAANTLLANDLIAQEFVRLAEQVARLYRGLLPDAAVAPYTIRVAFIVHLSRDLRRELPIPTTAALADQVAELIDQSVIAGPYMIRYDQYQNARQNVYQ